MSRPRSTLEQLETSPHAFATPPRHVTSSASFTARNSRDSASTLSTGAPPPPRPHTPKGHRSSPVHPTLPPPRGWSSGLGGAGVGVEESEKGDAERSDKDRSIESDRAARREGAVAEMLRRRSRERTQQEALHELMQRRCHKPDAIWSICLSIIGFACLVIHIKTPRLKTWQDRTVSPAVCVGTILAFGILWLGHLLGWSAHKLLPRVWSLIAFACFGLGLAGTLDGMEEKEGEPTRTPLLIKVAAFVTASLMHWGNFLMSISRQDKPLVQRQESKPQRYQWREGILV